MKTSEISWKMLSSLLPDAQLIAQGDADFLVEEELKRKRNWIYSKSHLRKIVGIQGRKINKYEVGLWVLNL